MNSDYQDVMRVSVPMVELEDHATIEGKLLVFDAPMPALEAQLGLIPKTAGLDITNRNERLWNHVSPCN